MGKKNMKKPVVSFGSMTNACMGCRTWESFPVWVWKIETQKLSSRFLHVFESTIFLSDYANWHLWQHIPKNQAPSHNVNDGDHNVRYEPRLQVAFRNGTMVIDQLSLVQISYSRGPTRRSFPALRIYWIINLHQSILFQWRKTRTHQCHINLPWLA